MKAMSYVFVSKGKIMQYMGEKLLINAEGNLEFIPAAESDL